MSGVDRGAFERALWAYPARWRRRHGEAMVGTMLDEAEHRGRRAPTHGDAWALAVSGLGERFVGWVPARLRDAAAQAALGVGFALALVIFVGYGTGPDGIPFVLGAAMATGPWVSPMVVTVALWVVAFSLTLIGAGRAARVALGLATAAALAVPATTALLPGWGSVATMTVVTLALLGVVGTIGTVRSRIGLAATSLGVIIVIGGGPWIYGRSAGAGTDRGFWLSLTPEAWAWLTGMVVVSAALTAVAKAWRVALHLCALAGVFALLLVARSAMWDPWLGAFAVTVVALVLLMVLGGYVVGARVARESLARRGRGATAG
ncbi:MULTISPECIES: hypothetical protein [unclassified Microbacterium]|uniref:hypothetical protein n=1 Tax=unclassified Microbacterium TaxID=2609290 RepID=UPI003869553B